MKYSEMDASKLKATGTFFYKFPIYAGHWTIGGNWHIYVNKRPRWLTRVMMKLLLEWDWAPTVPDQHSKP